MVSKKTSNIIVALSIIGFVTLSLLTFSTTPESLIAYIGIKNGYLVVFILAILSGISPLTGGSYILVMDTLVSGGMNPVALALTATVGDAIGGTTVYHLGRASRTLAPPGLINRFEHWLLNLHSNHPRLIPVVIFIYGASAPVSNDVITIPMGIVHYPYSNVFIPLQSGTFVYNLIAAYGGSYLYTHLINLLL